MQRENTDTIRADLIHGHSRLTWLMDELDAHLTGLAAEPTGAEYVLDEFRAYWAEFRDDLRDHIIEEEDELFPLVRLHATDSDLTELGELQVEHARLLIELEKFGLEMDALAESEGEERCPVIRRMQTGAKTMREHLVAHSRHERQFLREVEGRIADACLT